MTFESRDPAYLWDMLDAAQSIQSFTAGVDQEAYLKNQMMQYAVERQLGVIGEAARRVSEGFKKTHPEIPWREIIAQRNVLTHQYGEIRHDRIWQVITADIPALVSFLKPLIPPLPPEEP
ncbi:MAG: DUF86 domain-containing protein [Candidatus Manganitrophus sp. SB1]|nr:DUF86 domain-containing protein [Candidatus Manganitrophus morganii]